MIDNTTFSRKRRNFVSTRIITITALLASVSYILAFIEFPVPLSPSFARMDLSDIPAYWSFCTWTRYRCYHRIDKKCITAIINFNSWCW